MDKKTKRKITSHLIEFFIVGLVMGISEDMIAIKLATNEPFTLETFKIAALVAIPFAFVSEILVDMKIFRKILKKNVK